MEVKAGDIVLCKFYFTDARTSKNRPVLVLKDNLPFNDFVAIPISSQITNRHKDEHLIHNDHFVTGSIPKDSKVMLRKTFVVSKVAVIKKYGTLNAENYDNFHRLFCQYFECINN